MHRFIASGLMTSLLAAGCNLLVPAAVVMSPPTRKVPPEFARLSGHRVAVFVWVPPATMTVYPYARYDLARYVGDALARHVDGVQVVSAAGIEEFLNSTADPVVEPQELGRHFDADMVIYLQVLEFQVRDPATPNLLRARISASLSVVDLSDPTGRVATYPLSTVSVLYPRRGSISVFDTRVDEREVRRAACEVFAEEVARRFYEHEVEL